MSESRQQPLGLRLAVGDAVRERRGELELTQANCARRAGLSATSLCLIENGAKGVRLSVFWALAFALELRPAELARRVSAAAAENV